MADYLDTVRLYYEGMQGELILIPKTGDPGLENFKYKLQGVVEGVPLDQSFWSEDLLQTDLDLVEVEDLPPSIANNVWDILDETI